MDPVELLSRVLADVATGDARRAADVALAAEPELGSVAAALAGLASFWSSDFGAAADHAERALTDAVGTQDRALALAVVALVSVGTTPDSGLVAGPCTPPGTDVADPVAAVIDLAAASSLDDAWWSAVRYLAREAALMSARLTTAASVHGPGRRPSEVWGDHPFATVMAVCDIRVAAFLGRIAEAGEMLQQARGAVQVPRLAVLLDALDSLVLGRATGIAALAGPWTAPEEPAEQPEDLVDRGILMLAAYGAHATGDHSGAARAVFRAGGDAALTRCTVIDRALGFELLLAAAIADGDPVAATTWVQALQPLGTHPIAAPSVDRALARHALATGDLEAATELASRSIAACQVQGRVVEAADGELLLAEVAIARTDVAGAARRLRSLVRTTDSDGHGAVRRTAGAALAAVNRRLPPVAGARWAALSPREAAVARLVLDGLSTEEIAQSLSLSPRTVSTHISRILGAFEVSTRVGFLASIGPGQTSSPLDAAVSLTPRQHEVAALVAAGRTNAQIAVDLGIAAKTVERHVSDILVRWSVASRFEIARTWWANAPEALPRPAVDLREAR